MTCRECSGAGTLFVLDGYVDQHQPDVADDHPNVLTVRAKRAALANTVYPCPECQPARFKAWSGGAYAIAPLGTRSTVPATARKRERSEPLPMEPTWLEPADQWALPERRDLA